MAKPRVNLRLSSRLNAQLSSAAAQHRTSKTAVVEQALAAWFNPEARDRLEERLLGRLERIDHRLADVEHDLAMTSETLAHYVYYWLTRTEPLPEGERDIAHALGQKRFDHFIGQVARKLAARAGAG